MRVKTDRNVKKRQPPCKKRMKQESKAKPQSKKPRKEKKKREKKSKNHGIQTRRNSKRQDKHSSPLAQIRSPGFIPVGRSLNGRPSIGLLSSRL